MDTITETSKPNKWLEKLDAIRSEYAYDLEQATEAFEFVAKVIDLESDRLNECEPYATRAIERYRQMEMELHSFDNFTDSITNIDEEEAS